MKHPTRTAAAFISCSAAVLLACFLFRNPEPEYEGRKLSIWLNELSTSDEEGRALAREAIVGMGSQSVPTLVRLIRSIDSPFRRKAMVWLSKQSLVKIEFNEWENQIHGAMIALSTLGPEASSALPDFIELLPSQTWLAASVIAAIGPRVGNDPVASEAIPILLANLNENDADLRNVVRDALVAIGNEAVIPLIGTLADPNAITRKHAIEALAKIGTLPKRTVPAIEAALGDSDPDVRGAAAAALSVFGSDALESVPALNRCLKDSSLQVQVRASETIVRLSPGRSDALEHLIRLLGNPTVRVEAASAIGGTGSGGYAAIPALVRALEASLERSALVTARRSEADPSGKGETQAADQLLWSEGYFRVNLTHSLGRMGPAASEAIPVLLKALSDQQDWVRNAAAETLGRIGIAARSTVPQLIAASEDPDDNVRHNAILALAEIAPEDDAVLEILVRSVRDQKKEVRLAGCNALALMQTRKPDQIRALSDAAKDPSHEVRLAALKSLSVFGADAGPATPALVPLVNDRFKSVREAALKTMRDISSKTP